MQYKIEIQLKKIRRTEISKKTKNMMIFFFFITSANTNDTSHVLNEQGTGYQI